MENVAASSPTPQQPPPPTKRNSTLSVDRAAFLLLRVKRVFKKKRQQRKEKQQQLASAALAAQAGAADSRKMPPPLLRSRTLPAIIMPGLPIVTLHTEKQPTRLSAKHRGGFGSASSSSSSGNRWQLLSRGSNTHSKNNNNSCCHVNQNTLSVKSLILPKDDGNAVPFRRKSSGSTPYAALGQQQPHHQHTQQQQQQQHHQRQQIYAGDVANFQLSDNFECHADGSLFLRIPSPQVVPTRAYRLAVKQHGSTTSAHMHGCTNAQQSQQQLGMACCREGNEAEDGASHASAHTAFTRLAKLLHQSANSKSTMQQQQQRHQQPSPQQLGMNQLGLKEDAPRRLSWERRKDSSTLQRSASIDSFAEIVWNDAPRPSVDVQRVAPFSKRPSTSSLYSNCSTSIYGAGEMLSTGMAGSCSSAGSSRRESLMSPSSTRRNKFNRNKNDNLISNRPLNTQTECQTKRHGKCYDPDDDDENYDDGNDAELDAAANDEDDDDDDDAVSTVKLREYLTNNYNNNNNNNRKNINDNVCDNNVQLNCFNESHDLCNASTSRGQHKRDNRRISHELIWPEQLANNVSTVAKMRTAISCTAQNIKDMEFLLPHHTHKTQQHNTTNANNANNANGHDNVAKANVQSTIDKGAKSTQQLCIARQARDLPQRPTSADENQSANAPHSQLAVHRRPVSFRDNLLGSTTPHPNRNKMSKKQLKLAQAQLDKLTQTNLHLHALFSAVEHGHLEKARTIIESTDIDVNCINADGLSALDVAVLSNNRSMTRMLLQHGALDSAQFSVDSIGAKLNGLLKDAELRIHDLSGPEAPCQSMFLSRPSISSIIIGNSGSSVTGCTGNEIDKQIGICERRVKSLRRMLLGWDQARPPDAPASVAVDVTDENSIVVQILEPFEGAIGTKFKVQWSTRADFNNVVGERELMDWMSFHGTMGAQCHIGGLTQGRRYFIRAACGNVKDWGAYKTSIPASVVPSSWRDLNNRQDRYMGRQRVLDNLFTAVRVMRPPDASEIVLDPAGQKRVHKKKTTIKQLFSVASKFQKTLRRGIYLTSIVYYDDKVLVTSEEFPPVIEIDESYPSTLLMDYYWLMKVACTWEDVKLLRSDMERNLTSTVQFRTKLLTAICQMQSALGQPDLGQLYHKPLRDSKGTVVITCIQSVKSPKSVSILNSRWLSVHKLQKKIGALHEDSSINEILISSIGDQILYHQASLQTLEPGLYLGYLKMQCSMDQIQVVVPIRSPNVLPHNKVRDNSHITAEEWQILHRDEKSPMTGADVTGNALRLPLEFNNDPESTTEVQRLFLYDLTNAAHKLFATMNIKPTEAVTHRLYDVEVIEISKEISFLLICPSAELSCAVPGQTELLLQRDDLVSLSIQAFEIIHLRTYQGTILEKYARLSCILELDTALANHSQREAFSTSELQCAKERLAKLQELNASLASMWKGMRWLMDVIAFARDKNAPQPSLAMKEILDFAQAQEDVNLATPTKQHLLQLPIREVKFNKVGSGRGSWPGPDADTKIAPSNNEHSKSEQHLDLAAATPVSNQAGPALPPDDLQYKVDETQRLVLLGAGAGTSLRKNSGDSASSQHSFYSAETSVVGSNADLCTGSSCSASVQAIPSSRSVDALVTTTAPDLLRHTQISAAHRKRTSSSISHATSLSTPLITIQGSSSVPYLSASSHSMPLQGSSCLYANEFEHKPIMAALEPLRQTLSTVTATTTAAIGTLSALQADVKLHVSEATTAKAATTSSKSVYRSSNDEDTESCCSQVSGEQTSGIIQVYTAYNTGLASGTSLKLHVTQKTTAREVINLVVKQLNMAAVLKGNNGPIYTAEMLNNFCLVAVIGARERCLRDDFKPLQLQSPWRKGRLYVRQKHELLAAIEHSNRKSHLI